MDEKGLSSADRDNILRAMEHMDSILGIMDLTPPEEDREVEALVKKREEARKARDWGTADRIRDDLLKRGIEVVDTKDGPVWKKTR